MSHSEDVDVSKYLKLFLDSSGYDSSFDEFLRICHKTEEKSKDPRNTLFVSVMNSYIRERVLVVLSSRLV